METSALSLAYAAVDAATEGNAFESAALVRAKARGLLEGYDHRYRDAGWVAMGVEQTFHQPIVNPNSGRRSRTFTHARKWDGTVSFQGQAWLLEHKTTCQDISDLSAPYWRQLAIDSQVSVRYATGNQLSVFGALKEDKDRISEILQETWESADDWFVHDLS